MDGRNTTSTLKLIPSAKDHDAELICSAFNPVMIPASSRNVSSRDNEENHLAARTLSFPSSVETRRKLVVHCKNQFSFSSSFSFSFLSLFTPIHFRPLPLNTKTLILMTTTGDDEIFNNGMGQRRGKWRRILFFFREGVSFFLSPFIRKRERGNPIPQHTRGGNKMWWRLLDVNWLQHQTTSSRDSCSRTGEEMCRKWELREIPNGGGSWRRANSDTNNFFVPCWKDRLIFMSCVGVLTLIPRPPSVESFKTELCA
jgi:hypothetical protein